MKRFGTVLAVLLFAIPFCAAQNSSPAQSAPPAAQANGGKPQPRAKSQGEFTAFQESVSKPTPAEQELAAHEFTLKYPESELKTLLFLNVMDNYQKANNADKTIDIARKILELNPNEPNALLTIAETLASRTRETDLDREERLSEAIKSAEKALQTIDTEVIVPATATPEQVSAMKDSMKSTAEAAIGTAEITRKNYPSAEQHLLTATKLGVVQPDPVVWLRLAVARDQQKKYPEALEAANQAAKIAPPGSQAATLAASQQARLQKLVSGGGATPAPAPGAPTPQSSTPAPR